MRAPLPNVKYKFVTLQWYHLPRPHPDLFIHIMLDASQHLRRRHHC